MDRIDKTLLELGIRPSLIGYDYLHDAVELVLEDKTRLHGCITRRVYGEVAAKNGATASRVERAMRNGVETGTLIADPAIFDSYFGGVIDPQKGKPTVSEFLATVALHLREE